MDVVVSKESNVSVGDVIEFNHSGSHNEGSFYLICYSEVEGYFILNLSGKKSNKIKFYKSLSSLLRFHLGSIIKIYSKDEWNLTIARK